MDYLSNLIFYASFFVSLYFEVFMLINFIDKRLTLKTEEARVTKTFPSITIIVPVFNEEKTLTQTVFSLLKLDYPKNKLNIVIVNDGSTDTTPQIINRFKGNKRIEIITKENGGKHTALNEGLKKVTTDLVGCLDADSFVPTDTLKKMIPYFADEKIMAVTPAIKIHGPFNFIRHIQNNEYNLGIFMKKCFGILNSITVTPGPFSIFRKSVFENLGPFREAHNTEDLEIAMRMQSHFYKIANAHNAIVYTTGPATLRKLYRQRVRWIQGFLSNSIDYRFILFNKKYKNLGLFIMPSALISVLLFFASLGMIIWNSLMFLEKKIVAFQAVGWRFQLPEFHFDWFFINTDSKIFLSALLVAGTILLIWFGRKISEKKNGFSIHSFYFPFVYACFSIFWLSKATYNTVLSKETKWR